MRVGIAYVVVSWLLVQAAGVLEPALLLPDWVDRVVTVFLLIGFPIVLLFAWAFEMTPEGVRLTRDVESSESIAPKTGKKLEHLTIGALSLVVVFFLVKEFVPLGGQAPAEPTPGQVASAETVAAEEVIPPSIAVLPFEDFSQEADQGYFSRGIAEEILNLLAKTRGLRVAARTSSFAFADSDVDIRDIGNKLNVDTVLEGSIRKSGDKIRITAQLIKIEDGYHLWSETYDRDYSDIFKIQDEISAAIMGSLKVHLLGEEESAVVAERTQNMDAYSAYLIGKERLALLTKEDTAVARKKFEEAIAIDPEYAPAYAALARAIQWEENYIKGEPSPKAKAEFDREIDAALERSLVLSPNQPEAIAVRGLQHYRRYRYDEATADFNRAIDLNPNYALAYLWRSNTFYEQGRYLDMLADKEKAYALDPMSLEISSQLAYDYGAFWRPRDADRLIARMFELHPNHKRAYVALVVNLTAHGRYAEGLLALEEALEYYPDDKDLLGWYAWGLANLRLFDKAEAQGFDAASFWVNLDRGRLEKARELADSTFADKELPHWMRFGPRRALTWELKSEQGIAPFKSAVAEYRTFFDENNIPFTDECRLELLFDMKKAGIEDGLEEMMEKCRKSTEDRYAAKYLCPCSWFNLVWFATIDGRTDEAIARARQWLDNGDSFGMLHLDRVIQEWSDRPEYQEILERNDEQVMRQQALYLAGVTARERADAEQAATGGF